MVWLDEGGLERNELRLITPSGCLAPWVEHFWIQGTYDHVPARPWRIVPDFSPHVIFSIESTGRGEERAWCSVVGAREIYKDIHVARRKLTVGARLRPGALPKLTRSSADLFTDCAFRMED